MTERTDLPDPPFRARYVKVARAGNPLSIIPEMEAMTMQFSWLDMERATDVVRRRVPRTPAYCWPQLVARTGVELFLKHENHTPTGSFKARGGLVYVDALARKGTVKGLVTATRGNHGQSIAIASSAAGIPSLIVVPRGNSIEKNRAMEAFGGTLMESGNDFDEARAVAKAQSVDKGWVLVPSFDRDIVRGVATYAIELFETVADLDVVLVPIGMGSGICGLMSIRDLMGLKTRIIGVVAERAPAFSMSFTSGRPVTSPASTFADGVACREPQQEVVELVSRGAEDVVTVSEREIADAIRTIYECTHNLAEGAGAVAYAAVFKYRHLFAGQRVAAILTGGNIDRPLMASILNGAVPEVFGSPTGASVPLL